MASTENYGLIIKELRKLGRLNIREAALKISKSVGWLSEVERGLKRAYLSNNEFERIVGLLDGEKHKSMFKTWIARHKNQTKTSKTFDGAILKYIRIKKGLTLKEAAKLHGISFCYLSQFETGSRHLSVSMRHSIMKAYGYQPDSFKNLTKDPIKSKAIPSKFKLAILLRTLSAEQFDLVFEALKSQTKEELCSTG